MQQITIVTGGSRGIGAATARLCGGYGHAARRGVEPVSDYTVENGICGCKVFNVEVARLCF